MAVTITSGTQLSFPRSQSVETLTNSTATAVQDISAFSYVTTISGGTATGTAGVNNYALPEGPDGLEKLVFLIATGEATVHLTMATGQHYIGRDVAGIATATNYAGAVIGAATGALVLSAKTDYIRAIYLDGGWTVLGSNATFATVT